MRTLRLGVGLALALLTLAPTINGPVTVNGPMYVNQVLQPGVNHTCAIIGDSIGTDTPYTSMEVGTSLNLMTMFAADAAFTSKTGPDLAGAPGTVRNGTYDAPTDTLTLTSCNGGGCPVNFGATYRADAYWDGPDIDISANPSSRYLVEFDLDTKAMKSPDITPVPPATAVDLLDFYVRAVGSGCGTDADFTYADGVGGGVHTRFSWKRPQTHYAVVIDPLDWDGSGSDYSGPTKFGNGTCKLEPSFNLITDWSNAQVAVIVKNLTITRLNYATKVVRASTGSQTTPGVAEDDYPTLKTKHMAGKVRPVDCVILVSGRNDYDAQSGSYSGGASTVANYFSTLTTLGSTLVTDGVKARLKVIPFASTRTADSAQIYGMDNQAGAASGWQDFQVSERTFLAQQSVWKAVDTSRWGEYDPVPKIANVLLPSSLFPGAGSTLEYAIFMAPDDESSVFYLSQLIADATVTASAGNRYCFSVWNKTRNLQITSADVCTDAVSMNAYGGFGLPVSQNTGVKPNEVFTLKMTRTGTPSAAPTHLLVQYQVRNSQNMTPGLMYDTQHPSMMGYRWLAEAIYQGLTGKVQ